MRQVWLIACLHPLTHNMCAENTAWLQRCNGGYQPQTQHRGSFAECNGSHLKALRYVDYVDVRCQCSLCSFALGPGAKRITSCSRACGILVSSQSCSSLSPLWIWLLLLRCACSLFACLLVWLFAYLLACFLSFLLSFFFCFFISFPFASCCLFVSFFGFFVLLCFPVV